MARAGASEIDWIGDATEVCVCCAVCVEKKEVGAVSKTGIHT